MIMLRLGYFKIKFGDNEQCSLFTVFTVFAPAEIVHQKNIYITENSLKVCKVVFLFLLRDNFLCFLFLFSYTKIVLYFLRRNDLPLVPLSRNNSIQG